MASPFNDLPPHVRKAYSDYKNYTSYVIDWLVETAKSKGYFDPKQSKGKGKGRQRTNADTANRDPSQYKVSSVELKRLANCLRDKNAVVTHTFKTALNQAIDSREKFSSKFGSYFGTHGNASTSSHDEFVNVLKEVRGALRNLAVTGDAEAGASNPQQLANTFQHLKVYEPSKTLTKPSEMPIEAQPTRVNYTPDLPISPVDVLMEFALLVEQMDDMRSYLRTVWTRYTARTVDLTAAALATNTAQELVQQMISDFENKFKETTMDFKQLTSGHFRMCCEAEGLPYNEGDQTWDDETYRAAENSYYFVYSIVVQYTKDDPTLKGNPKQQDEKRAKAKAMQPWIENIRQRPGFDKAKADASLLMESLGGLFSPFEGARRPTFDEDYRRLRKTLRDGVVFLDSAFAAQVSLDISSIIEGQADRPPQELERQLNVVQAGINSYLGSHKDLHNTNLTPVQIDSMVKIWDLALAIRQSLAEGRLFRKSTVLIGMLVLFFRHTYFQIGWNVANCWHYITFCAHIVNAMGVSGIQKNWLDMKCAQELLGLKSFFPGEKVPRDGGGVKRSFLLNCGLSSTTFATGGVRPRNDSEMFSKSGARPLIDSAKIHKKFCVDSLTKGLREPYTLDQLEQVIEESPGVSDDLYDKETRNLINELEAERTKKVQTRTGGSTNNNRGGSSQKKRSVACPERAIERLLQAIQYENTIVKFPYLDLHCKCLHVLRDMVHHCGPALPGNGDDYHAKGNHFGVFAAELLERTFGSEHLHANTRPMELATEALEEHIQNEGTTCCFEIMRSLQGMGTERGTFNWDLENNKGRQLNGFSLKEGSLWHDDISFRTDIVIRDGKWYVAKKQQNENIS